MSIPAGLVASASVCAVAVPDGVTRMNDSVVGVRVADVAVPIEEVTTASLDDEVTEVLARMSSTESGRAVVLRADRVVGLLSPVDVMRRVEVAGLRSGR